MSGGMLGLTPEEAGQKAPMVQNDALRNLP